MITGFRGIEVERESPCCPNAGCEVVLGSDMLEVAFLLDLLDVDEVLSDEDDIVEAPAPDSGMQYGFAHRSADYSLGENARPLGGGVWRLDGAHHLDMILQRRASRQVDWLRRRARKRRDMNGAG